MKRESSDDVVTAAAGAAALVAVAMLALLALYTLMELVRVYSEHAQPGKPGARPLWCALLALLGAWVCAALLTAGDQVELGAYLAAWSFLAYVIFVAVVDRRLRPPRPEPEDPGDLDQLDTYLGSHKPVGEPQVIPAGVSPNGRANGARQAPEWVA